MLKDKDVASMMETLIGYAKLRGNTMAVMRPRRRNRWLRQTDINTKPVPFESLSDLMRSKGETL